MVQENEIAMLLLGLIVLVFMFMYYDDFRRVPSYKLLTIAYCFLVFSFISTVLEGFFWGTYLNYLEHICNALNGIVAALWTWKVFVRVKETRG